MIELLVEKKDDMKKVKVNINLNILEQELILSVKEKKMNLIIELMRKLKIKEIIIKIIIYLVQ